MGANPTQAYAAIAFLTAFVLISAGLAVGGNILLIVIGLAFLGLSAVLFRRCKPWEQQES
jgi:hypothetical protein